MSAEHDVERGIELSTFSIIGRCERTGMFGIPIATSEMAVGSRCIHVAPGVGAVICQASTNPRLGFLGLNLLRAGWAAPRVVEEMAVNDQWVERRQLGCIDIRGLSAGRTGSGNRQWAGHRAGPQRRGGGQRRCGASVWSRPCTRRSSGPPSVRCGNGSSTRSKRARARR